MSVSKSAIVDIREQQFLSLKALSTYSKCLRCPLELVWACQKKKKKAAYMVGIPDPTRPPCLFKEERKRNGS